MPRPVTHLRIRLGPDLFRGAAVDVPAGSLAAIPHGARRHCILCWHSAYAENSVAFAAAEAAAVVSPQHSFLLLQGVRLRSKFAAGMAKATAGPVAATVAHTATR